MNVPDPKQNIYYLWLNNDFYILIPPLMKFLINIIVIKTNNNNTFSPAVGCQWVNIWLPTQATFCFSVLEFGGTAGRRETLRAPYRTPPHS